MKAPVFYVTSQHIMIIKFLQPDPEVDLATWLGIPDEIYTQMNNEETKEKFYNHNAQVAADFISEYSCRAFIEALVEKLQEQMRLEDERADKMIVSTKKIE